MPQVTLEEAAAHLPRLVEQINENGEDVVIMQGSKPVAKLVSLPSLPERPRPQFGSAKGLILYMADDFDAPLDDFAEYM